MDIFMLLMVVALIASLISFSVGMYVAGKASVRNDPIEIVIPGVDNLVTELRVAADRLRKAHKELMSVHTTEREDN